MAQHELAERLGMTVGELIHGRGTPMSAHEMAVDWPLYLACKHEVAAWQQEHANGGSS